MQRFGLCTAAVSILFAAAMTTAAHAGTVPADLRVVTDTNRVLADVRQYTDTTAVPTSPQAKCFFGGVGGSGRPVTVAGATALGVVADAAQSLGSLSPILVTDEYSFGLGVCGFGGVSSGPANFWQVRVDHKATQVGGDQVALSRGDDVVWALVPSPVCDFNPPYTCKPTEPELVIEAPARARPGVPFTATVFEYNDTGFNKPALGASVNGALAPTDAQGHTQVTLARTGAVTASRVGAIPSRSLRVCVSARPKRCAAKRGRQILGSQLADRIGGTLGNDTIEANGGDDAISVRGRGRDSVRCGPGKDTVTADGTDRVNKASCEKIERSAGGAKSKRNAKK
ncbi:MAG: hypothetical protein ABR536_03070 [Solirubrobacterales bacterium]